MILDAIIGLLLSLFTTVIELTATMCIFLINLVLAGVEAIVSIFVSGFTLRRIERKKGEGKGESKFSKIAGSVILLILVGVVTWFLVKPVVMNRNVTLIAEDGHSLPFAAVVIQANDQIRHDRTGNAGNLTIPRFGEIFVTVRDPRYVEQTWERSEIGSELIVKRTVLGSSLDSLSDKLLKPES